MNVAQYFFESWDPIIRLLIVGVTAYFVLIVLLRGTGKRTLSKMNAFDFVVTVALGSTLATILLNKEVPLAEGGLALALLIFLQYAVTWLAVRSSSVKKLIKGEPRLLFHGGDYLLQAMKAERVTVDEMLQAVRSQGTASMEEIEAIVLETDGRMSVMQKSPGSKHETFSNVVGVPKSRKPEGTMHID